MDSQDATNPAEPLEEVTAPEVEPNDEPDSEVEVEAEAESDTEDKAEQAEEFIEVERDGKTYRIPKAAEPLLMFQQDYTRKTQDLAEQRRQFEAARQEAMAMQETREALFQEEAQLVNVRQGLARFQNVNWQAFAAQDPAGYTQAHAEYTNLKEYHDRLSAHVEGRKAELSQKSEQETAIALERAMSHLNNPKPEIGWDGKFDASKRTTLTNFGLELGFTNEELANTTHPLMIQTLNLARIGYETLRKQTASLKKPVVEAKPVPQVTSSKTRTQKDPDKMPIKDWVKWRNEQERKKRESFR